MTALPSSLMDAGGDFSKYLCENLVGLLEGICHKSVGAPLSLPS